jgi:tetratricopeptide (TPR) repeat protein
MKFLAKLKNFHVIGGLLRVTILTGLILIFLAGILLITSAALAGYGRENQKGGDFYGSLRDWDRAFNAITGTAKEIDRLSQELDKLKKKTLGVESWLSILKRRRILADSYSAAVPSYNEAVKRAVKAYPYSQAITAIAAAALIKDSALTNETENQIRAWLPLLLEPEFGNLRLSIHVLLGDFKNPLTASSLPRDLATSENEIIIKDLAILNILRGDIRGAAAMIQGILSSPIAVSDEFLRFTAEYYYDFGDLQRAAQIFSVIPGDKALQRQADALYLAGFIDNARSIWKLLLDSPDEKSLYNLAMSAFDKNETFNYLEKLVYANPNSETISRQAGIIRYSRILGKSQAIAVLENSNFSAKYPYIDLEIRKRRSEDWSLGRQIAETWLLLDRHPENEELYEWAAWFIFFQRFYDEADFLFRRAWQYQFDGDWVKLYKALKAMSDNKLDEASDIFLSIPEESWYIHANLGRILEAERSVSRAVTQYERAASLINSPIAASRIQYRIARCFIAMGNVSEAIRALSLALDFDPDNASAHFELDKLSQK